MIMPGRLYSLFIYQPWSDVNVKPIGMLHRQSSHLSRPSPTRSCTVADLQLQRPSSRKGHGWNFEGVDLLFVQIRNTTHFWNPFFFSVFFFPSFFLGGKSRRTFLRLALSGSRYGFRIRCAQGCVHSGKSLQRNPAVCHAPSDGGRSLGVGQPRDFPIPNVGHVWIRPKTCQVGTATGERRLL